MRFIHVGDINIGANPDSDKSWGKERAACYKETFKKVVDKAKETDCDLLLISGNLFCHQPVTRELSEINLLFSTIPATRVVITAGAADRVRKNSSVLNFKWNKNVSYVTGGYEKIKLPDIHTTVYAVSVTEETGEDEAFPLLEKIKKDAEEDREYINIFTGFDRFFSPKEAELLKESFKEANFSYIALGGSREPVQLINERCAYSGLLEPLGMGNSGEHGIYTGDISAAGKRMINFEFVKMSETSYIPLQIEVNETVGKEALSGIISREIEKRGKNNIYKIRITGKKSPDTDFDFKSLIRLYRIEEITDDSEPQYDFPALFAEHPEDIIGFYISSVLKDDSEPGAPEKKAMYYAVNALLKTEKKRETK